MKKSLSYIATAVIGALIIGGAVIFVSLRNSDTAVTSLTFSPVNACDTLTLTEAKSLLGTTTSQVATDPTTTSRDVQTSNCRYVQGTEAVVITVRSPLHSAGLLAIEDSFHSRMYRYTAVKGYGHHAYFDAATGQLNVHDDGSWYTISLRGNFSPAKVTPIADRVFN